MDPASGGGEMGNGLENRRVGVVHPLGKLLDPFPSGMRNLGGFTEAQGREPVRKASNSVGRMGIRSGNGGCWDFPGFRKDFLQFGLFWDCWERPKSIPARGQDLAGHSLGYNSAVNP